MSRIRTRRDRDALWTNWAGNQRCAPVKVARPSGAEDLVNLVNETAEAGRTLKVVGSGHSFTDVACTNGVMVRMDGHDKVLETDHSDPDHPLVRVQAGIKLGDLNDALADRGMALRNLGDIAYQTVAGAMSTSTHGTGSKLGGLATQIKGMELVTADGSVRSLSASEDPEGFQAARVGLGALGIVSTYTLECVPAFNLHAIEEPMRLDDMLERLDDLVDTNEHFEAYWVPHTGWALTKANNSTSKAVARRSRTKEFVERVVLENVAFGAVCRLGRWNPEWIPTLARVIPSTGRSEFVDRSDRIFTSPRMVHFYEMEYSIPRAEGAETVRRLRRFVEDSGLRLSFPVEIRFAAPDDIFLSTANGRPSCYIAVHVYRGMGYEQYFRGVEAIMDSVGGRPHWGKLHYQTASTLSSRYPDWERFKAVRRRFDPHGLFANAYTERVLGPA
ncbi:MAG: D-arabinono-1,4-lactone oxidase [Acidimicrobiales bacterium]